MGRREWKQHAEAEVVAAEQHVEEHGERKDRAPDERQDDGKDVRGHGFPAAAMGLWERSASPSSGTGGVSSGPRLTSLAM